MRYSAAATRNLSDNGVRKLVSSYTGRYAAVIDDFKMQPGMIYTQVRAISARINQNYDAWPSEELKKSFRTFLGKPVFVNHQNFDPEKARGRVVAARYRESGNDRYIEVIQEIDAVRFPKLAKEIHEGGLDSVSMGVEAGFTKCSVCDNRATDITDMCAHVKYHKGEKLAHVETGEPTLVYENCYKLGFFELSYVFDPADETAVVSRVVVANRRKASGPKYEVGDLVSAVTRAQRGLKMHDTRKSGEVAAVLGPFGPDNPKNPDSLQKLRSRPDYDPEKWKSYEDDHLIGNGYYYTVRRPGTKGKGQVHWHETDLEHHPSSPKFRQAKAKKRRVEEPGVISKFFLDQGNDVLDDLEKARKLRKMKEFYKQNPEHRKFLPTVASIVGIGNLIDDYEDAMWDESYGKSGFGDSIPDSAMDLMYDEANHGYGQPTHSGPSGPGDPTQRTKRHAGTEAPEQLHGLVGSWVPLKGAPPPDPGSPVFVHYFRPAFERQKKTGLPQPDLWSVDQDEIDPSTGRKRRRVRGYTDQLHLGAGPNGEKVQFRVDKGGAERASKEEVRNVHAGAVGYMVPQSDQPLPYSKINYFPFRKLEPGQNNYFYHEDNEEPVSTADQVHFSPNFQMHGYQADNWGRDHSPSVGRSPHSSLRASNLDTLARTGNAASEKDWADLGRQSHDSGGPSSADENPEVAPVLKSLKPVDADFVRGRYEQGYDKAKSARRYAASPEEERKKGLPGGAAPDYATTQMLSPEISAQMPSAPTDFSTVIPGAPGGSSPAGYSGSPQSGGSQSVSPSGGAPSQSLTEALQRAGISPEMYPLISGFAAAEGNNPSGAPTLGFTDSQAGSSLDQHAQALAQQLQNRQSVSGPFPHGGSPSDQASWMATVVGQTGNPSDWQGNAQPARSDYVNRIVQNMPPPSTSTPHTSGPGGTGKIGRGMNQRYAWGEIEAPEDIDTLRDESDDDGSDEFHHYVKSPKELQTPDFDKAQRLDRAQEEQGLDSDRRVEDVEEVGSQQQQQQNYSRSASRPVRNTAPQEKIRRTQKGRSMGINLSGRGKVASRGRRFHADDNGQTDGGPYGRDDQGEQEEVFLSQTPAAEAVATPNAGDQISNTENTLVARVQHGTAQLRRDATALAYLRQQKQALRRQAGDNIIEPTTVNPPLSGTDDQSLKGDDFDSVALDSVATQPKDASIHAFAAFDDWLARSTGKTARQHGNANFIRREAARYIRATGVSLDNLFPTLEKVLVEARKAETKREANMRRVADESLEVAAPGDRIDVEAPVKNTTDAEAQASQYALSDYAQNAGDNIADPDLSTDSQFWAPGSGKTSNRTADAVAAVRCAEAYINAGLAPSDDKWKLIARFQTMRHATVVDRTRLLEAKNELDRSAVSRQRSAAVSRGTSIPRGLGSGQRTAQTNRVATNDPSSDSLLFFK
jgi:hypothetical protein